MLMFRGHNRKKKVLYLRYREYTTLKRMIHHLRIINPLGYWQMGACGGNCTKNVHQVYDANAVEVEDLQEMQGTAS